MSEVKWILKSNGDPRSLKAGVGVQTATLGKVGTTMNAVSKRVCLIAGDTGLDSLPGDEWYEVVDVTLIEKTGKHSGWMAARHKGQTLCSVTAVEPEPEVLPLTVTIETEYHAPQTVTLLPK